MPPSIFARHSSEIDWCETNYLHSEYVAEYYNTISNVSFLLVGPLMMYLLHPYACKRTLMVHGVWILFTVIGLVSIYYHMTLSFFGQLLDELSILWVICLGYAIWFPRKYFPRFIETRSQFGMVILITAVISTLLSFVKPTINAYVLNSIAFHILYVLWKEIRKHIFICLTVGHINTVFAYFDAQYEISECPLQVQYWPFKSRHFGLPYLAITKSKEPKKIC
ncbi:alkaline ceramidase 1 isoform X2 [Hyperolius riggenbachi]|uniref:alkaline ceramidase 1 isoform X2 n=1 Tax=Hyperolius riggenbachi TaxID=752182 RepID=UPI0035A2E320